MRRKAAWIVACLALAGCGQPEDRPPTKTVEVPPTPVASPAAAPATTPDWSGLEGLIGKTPQDSGLFDSSVVAPDLKTLLGEKLAVLKANTQTVGPLVKDGGVFFIIGNKAHQGGIDDAYVLIDPASHGLEVGLREAGKLTVYKTRGAAISKPKDVETFLSNAEQAGR